MRYLITSLTVSLAISFVNYSFILSYQGKAVMYTEDLIIKFAYYTLGGATYFIIHTIADLVVEIKRRIKK